MITRPRPRARRAEQITQPEIDVHYWLGRLSASLAIWSHDLPAPLRDQARKTLDEFLASGASSENLARVIRDEVKRP